MVLTTVNYRRSSRSSDNMKTITITIKEKSTKEKLLNDVLNRKTYFSRTNQIFSIGPILKFIY